MGGDIVAGTNFVEALIMFEHDENTEAIILVGEVGGRAEQDAAEWIKEYNRRATNPKPIVGCVGGLTAPNGRVMGHAGAFASLGEQPSSVKHEALKDAGVTMVSHPTHFPNVLKPLLSHRVQSPQSSGRGHSQQRGYHTLRQRPRPAKLASQPPPANSSIVQRRNLHISGEPMLSLLSKHGITVRSEETQDVDKRYLGITVDRTNRCPAIVASPSTDDNQKFVRARYFPYDYNDGPTEPQLVEVFRALQMDAAPPMAMATLGKLVRALVSIFKEKEAFALSTHLTSTDNGDIAVDRAEFSFDDSAYKSGKRQEDIFSQRDKVAEDPDEVEAEQYGIVYVKYQDHSASIGTLINGAGLAMNASDALVEFGARPTNFLDTGGKATSETIQKCFELLLRDDRVRVIFVNIFGGLTDCGMIAEGIMKAFQELGMRVPVVVRLRGTNEAKGQRMVSWFLSTSSMLADTGTDCGEWPPASRIRRVRRRGEEVHRARELGFEIAHALVSTRGDCTDRRCLIDMLAACTVR